MKIVFESDEYKIYSYSGSDQFSNYVDAEIKVYANYSDLPELLKKEILNNQIINSLYYRLNLKHAILLTIHNETEIIAYGWLQTWHPFKRKFGWIYKDAMMLGPYWTNELHRGKGIYGRLIKQSIALAKPNIPLMIYTRPENISSQKGIEKMGFKEIGVYKIELILRYFCFHKKIT
jgi:hypothetical protein